MEVEDEDVGEKMDSCMFRSGADSALYTPLALPLALPLVLPPALPPVLPLPALFHDE